MPRGFVFKIVAPPLIALVGVLFTGCGPPSSTSNVNAANANISTNRSNLNSSSNSASTEPSIQFTEPNSYQAVIRLTLETMSDQSQKSAAMPPLVATVPRSGADRMMEFTLPTNEKCSI